MSERRVCYNVISTSVAPAITRRRFSERQIIIFILARDNWWEIQL